MRACVRAFVCVCARARVCVCVCVCARALLRACVRTCVRAFVHECVSVLGFIIRITFELSLFLHSQLKKVKITATVKRVQMCPAILHI